MKKRLVAILVLALAMVLALTSCDFFQDIMDKINPSDEEYTVYFITGDGATYVPNQSVKKGELVTKPENPTRDGFDFDNWYKDEALTVVWNFETDKVTNHTMIYAKWNEHFHEGGEATCESGPICTKCGEEYGEALGHKGGTATCTEAAVCEVCGESYGDPLGHKGGEATCKDLAVCEVCGESYGELADHTEETLEAVAPTCTETGLTEGKKCSVCGEILVAQEEVSALGHTEETLEAVAPTCTQTGLTEGKKCSVCGEILVAQEEVPALGHTEETLKAVAPTCTETGLTEGKKCSVCGETLVAQTVVNALGHTPVVDEAVAPTCAKTGLTEGSHCSVCGETLVAQTVVNTIAHTFVNSVCVVCDAEYVAGESKWTLTTALKNGDRVLIGAPAYGKLLSAEKVSATSYYNKGVNYSEDDFTNVTDAEIFVVTVNTDGTYTFTSLTGDVIALAASYSSLNATGEHKSWALTDRGDGTFLVKNTGRNLYLEWYDSKGNWSTYSAGNTAEYYLSFYVMTEAEGDHVHNHISSVVAPTCTEAGYTSYTCSCGDSYKVEDGEPATGHKHVPTVTDPTCTEAGYTTYTCVCGDSYKKDGAPATGHTYVDGKCHCGEVDPDHVQPGAPVVEGGSADFDTIKTSNANGDSSYKKTFTTANGWVVAYSAIQSGGATVMNPQFPVIGPDNTHKAVCLTGKTTAPGKVTSPTLTTGISKLTINYTKMFSDTELSVTVTITDLASGNQYTHVISQTLDKNEKYVVYTEEWVLETPVVGDFTIEIVNNCPSNVNKDKDRFTILDLSWEGAAAAHVHEYAETTTATCTEAGVTTYTCECGDTYTEEVDALGHVDANLDVECDRDGCTSKVAPAADSLLSNFTANCLGSKLSVDRKYYVEGVIVEVLDQKNGIFLIDDGTGEKFYFRLPKNADDVSHANWAIKLTLGDKVSVYGKINKYSTSSAPNGQYWPAIQGGVATLLEQHPHDFTFKGADCTNPAYCACGQSYGDPRGCVDANEDNICDDCGRNTKYTYEYVEIRTDNNSGVIDTAAGTYTWSNNNFDVQVSKGTATQLYSTAKDHMRLYKNNKLVINNKNGLVVKTITIYVTNATQVTNFEKFLTGYTYTKDTESFTITIEINSAEDITFTNPGSSTQIKGVEFGYEK